MSKHVLCDTIGAGCRLEDQLGRKMTEQVGIHVQAGALEDQVAYGPSQVFIALCPVPDGKM